MGMTQHLQQHGPLLQRSLLNLNSPYALSLRLMIGIQQCYQKYSNVVSSSSVSSPRVVVENDRIDPNENDNENDNYTDSTKQHQQQQQQQQQPELFSLLRSDDVVQSNDDSMIHTINESVLSVLAQLLYCIHIQIPLQCCLYKTTLLQARQYLGSYVDTGMSTTTTTTITSAGNHDSLLPPPPTDTTDETPLIIHGNHVTNGNSHENHHDHHHHHNTHNNNSNNHNISHTGSLEEVFAAESDDSDYEFESDYVPHTTAVLNHHPNYTSWMTTIEQSYDPLHVSKPTVSIESITWNHIATAIVPLIRSVSYTTFTSILPYHWKQQNLSEPILQLSIALLIPSSSQHSPVLMTTLATPATTATLIHDVHWQQQLGVQLVNVFRDLTMYHINTMKTNLTKPKPSTSQNYDIGSRQSTTRHNDAIVSLLEDYLRLIRILLQGDQPKNATVNASLSSSSTLLVSSSSSSSPAILVGLSSLSSLCNDVVVPQQPEGITNTKSYSYYLEKVIRTIQCTVIDLSYELTDLLVQALTKRKEDLVAIQWAFLSLFQILTVPTSSTTTTRLSSRSNDTTINIMSNEYAQLLLNSGLFRQWLLVWTHSHQQFPNDEENKTVSMAVQECILDLCLASPSLLGKYAWRFPALTDIVLSRQSDPISMTSYDPTSVSGLCWNLLGMHYTTCSSSSQSMTPTIRWKQNTKSDPNIIVDSTKSYQEQAWVQFQSMCTNTMRILTDWKIRREHDIDFVSDSSKNPNHSQLQTIVFDWNHFVRRLTTNPFLCQLFYDMVEQQLQQQSALNLHDNREQGKITAATAIRAEISPIQRLMLQCPTSLNETASSHTSLQANEGDDAGAHRADDDEDNDKDRSVKKKSVQRSRMKNDQEMKWIGVLRKSMKVLLATTDAMPTGNETEPSPSYSQNRVTVSNKTD